MTNKINLIELLSLFSPSGDFPSPNFKINVYDFYSSKLKINEPLQEFVKSYYALNPDLSFNNLVEAFWIDSKSEVLTVYIDSSSYKQSCKRYVKLDALVKLLDQRQRFQVSYWSFGCDSNSDLVPNYCFSSGLYLNSESFHEFVAPTKKLVANLTVQHSVKDNSYMLIINAFDSTTLTRLYKLADYKKPQEAPSHE